jgi:hypothetical protein
MDVGFAQSAPDFAAETIAAGGINQGDNDNADGGASSGVSGSALSSQDETLRNEAYNAKTKLVDEINTISSATEESKADVTETEDATAAAFVVEDPQMKGSVVMYTVKGADAEGEFTVMRRFNDFLALRASLITSWPGCYIPFLPEKTMGKSMGKKEIEERRELLQRFLRELAAFDYIINSSEFKIFSRN